MPADCQGCTMCKRTRSPASRAPRKTPERPQDLAEGLPGGSLTRGGLGPEGSGEPCAPGRSGTPGLVRDAETLGRRWAGQGLRPGD